MRPALALIVVLIAPALASAGPKPRVCVSFSTAKFDHFQKENGPELSVSRGPAFEELAAARTAFARKFTVVEDCAPGDVRAEFVAVITVSNAAQPAAGAESYVFALYRAGSSKREEPALVCTALTFERNQLLGRCLKEFQEWHGRLPRPGR
jgi:hypothetical protein